MKKLAVLVAMIALVGSARADIAINWSAGTGFYNWNWNDVGSAGGVALDDGDYINFGGGSATAYLIWSSDNIIDFDSGNLAGSFVSGNDIVLDSVASINVPYGEFSNGGEVYAGALSTVGSMVFIRLIDLSAPGGAIAQYFDGPTLTPNTYDPQNPLLQPLNGNSVAGAQSGLGDQMIAVVPEPSVLAFLGLGGLALAVRRRMQA